MGLNTRSLANYPSSSSEAGAPCVNAHAGICAGDWRKPVPYRDVMGVVKQGLGCDFDRLHELVNQHMTLREFLGQVDIGDKKRIVQTDRAKPARFSDLRQ